MAECSEFSGKAQHFLNLPVIDSKTKIFIHEALFCIIKTAHFLGHMNGQMVTIYLGYCFGLALGLIQYL